MRSSHSSACGMGSGSRAFRHSSACSMQGAGHVRAGSCMKSANSSWGAASMAGDCCMFCCNSARSMIGAANVRSTASNRGTGGMTCDG